jgi:hypothetical protein
MEELNFQALLYVSLIRIISPAVDEHVFVCRKNYHALNIQGICDHWKTFISSSDCLRGVCVGFDEYKFPYLKRARIVLVKRPRKRLRIRNLRDVGESGPIIVSGMKLLMAQYGAL